MLPSTLEVNALNDLLSEYAELSQSVLIVADFQKVFGLKVAGYAGYNKIYFVRVKRSYSLIGSICMECNNI